MESFLLPPMRLKWYFRVGGDVLPADSGTSFHASCSYRHSIFQAHKTPQTSLKLQSAQSPKSQATYASSTQSQCGATNAIMHYGAIGVNSCGIHECTLWLPDTLPEQVSWKRGWFWGKGCVSLAAAHFTPSSRSRPIPRSLFRPTQAKELT